MAAAALVVAACSREAAPTPAASPTRARGVEVALGDSGPRPPEQHPTPETVVRPGIGEATDPHHQHIAGTAEAPDSALIRRQLAAAKERAVELMKLQRLDRAGYHVGSYYAAGIGSHYINWPQLERPFAPDAPTMLLVDTTPGHIPRLAGFSYWVRSVEPPAGFSGDFDHWHVHRGLCFIDDVLTQEDVPSPDGCRGTWLDGSDLWMLHVWVVPGYDNPDGMFAPVNPKLCPPHRANDGVSC
jgi:hypothetical protein